MERRKIRGPQWIRDVLHLSGDRDPRVNSSYVQHRSRRRSHRLPKSELKRIDRETVLLRHQIVYGRTMFVIRYLEDNFGEFEE